MKYFIAFVIFFAVFGSVNISITKNNDKTDIEYKPSTGITVTKSKNEKEDDDCHYTMCSALGGGVSGDTLAISTMFGE